MSACDCDGCKALRAAGRPEPRIFKYDIGGGLDFGLIMPPDNTHLTLEQFDKIIRTLEAFTGTLKQARTTVIAAVAQHQHRRPGELPS